MLLYQWHELSRHWMAPWAHLADANARIFSDPSSWLSALPGAQRVSAYNELLHRLGKDSQAGDDLRMPHRDVRRLADIAVEVVEPRRIERCRFRRLGIFGAQPTGLRRDRQLPGSLPHRLQAIASEVVVCPSRRLP